ncbi:MAG: zinc-binding protein [Erysipelotrichia bacterium]|nr:zinc-binding protein [Erysipelotrichia bacterium]
MQLVTTFICRSCGSEYNVSLERQKFLSEKGYDSTPVFCDDCIAARLDQIWETPGEKRLAICADCGCETKPGFVPSQDRPVYCPECFKKRSVS